MDVSNRLWEQLVFSFVPVRSLLHCRATCREWRVQLDGSRLWLPFTQSLAWLRLEERLAGWHGVQQAMAREAATLRNASAGHSVVGPIMESQEPPMYVGGKYIVARDGHTFLVDAKTGATSAVAGALVTQPKQALQERFVVAESAEHGVVLDCVTGHVHTYAPALSGHDSSWRLVSASGLHFSHRTLEQYNIKVARIVVHANGDVTVEEVTRFVLPNLDYALQDFALCENGASYLLLDRSGELHVHDLAIRRLKRTIKSAKFNATAMVRFGEFDDLVLCSSTMSNTMEEDDDDATDEYASVIRISDGSESQSGFDHAEAPELSAKGRVVVSGMVVRYARDRRTGSLIHKEGRYGLHVDHSGAMAWDGENGSEIWVSSGAPGDSKGHRIAAPHNESWLIKMFRFGTLFVSLPGDKSFRALHLDAAATADAHTHKGAHATHHHK